MRRLDVRTSKSIQSLMSDSRFQDILNWLDESYAETLRSATHAPDSDRRTVNCGRALELEQLITSIRGSVKIPHIE